MYITSFEQLAPLAPFQNGHWNQEHLYQYLVYSCNKNLSSKIDAYFAPFCSDRALAELLFSFLLDDDYDGSDSQMGAAYYLRRMDREVLRSCEALLRKAQENEVFWKRPFPNDEHLQWL